jgi:putative addiction module component (TIGR02574 family)
MTMSASTTPEMQEARELIDRALKLSPLARETIALELFDSLEGPPDDPDEVKKEWKDEIARRIGDLKSGRVVGIDADEALAAMRQRLREKYGA